MIEEETTTKPIVYPYKIILDLWIRKTKIN